MKHAVAHDARSMAVVSLSSLSKSEMYEYLDTPSITGDPAEEFDRKVAALADILNCTEEEATQIILHAL